MSQINKIIEEILEDPKTKVLMKDKNWREMMGFLASVYLLFIGLGGVISGFYIGCGCIGDGIGTVGGMLIGLLASPLICIIIMESMIDITVLFFPRFFMFVHWKIRDFRRTMDKYP